MSEIYPIIPTMPYVRARTSLVHLVQNSNGTTTASVLLMYVLPESRCDVNVLHATVRFLFGAEGFPGREPTWNVSLNGTTRELATEVDVIGSPDVGYVVRDVLEKYEEARVSVSAVLNVDEVTKARLLASIQLERIAMSTDGFTEAIAACVAKWEEVHFQAFFKQVQDNLGGGTVILQGCFTAINGVEVPSVTYKRLGPLDE